MSTLLAASYPERVSALVLYGTWPRLLRADDYPQGVPRDAFDVFVEAAVQDWGGPVALQLWAPGFAGNEQAERWWAKLLRSGSGPAGAAALLRLYTEIDVRGVLGTITAPTLVLHRRGDRLMPVAAGRAVARGIPGARMVELEGEDHLPIVDPEQILDELEEFLTGARSEPEPDRMLATVMFTDIVDSTSRAVQLGDRALARAGGAPRRARAGGHRPPPRAGDQDDGRRVPGDLRRPGARDPRRDVRARCRALARPRDPRRPAHRRGRGDEPGHRRHRRQHRRARGRAGGAGRGARLAHRRPTSSPARDSSSRTAARTRSRACPASGSCSRACGSRLGRLARDRHQVLRRRPEAAVVGLVELRRRAPIMSRRSSS